MTTSTAQKINLNNCTYGELFKALARIEARIATTSVRDKDRVAHPIKHIAAMAEHYVPSDADNVSTTRLERCDRRQVAHLNLPQSPYGTASGRIPNNVWDPG